VLLSDTELLQCTRAPRTRLGTPVLLFCSTESNPFNHARILCQWFKEVVIRRSSRSVSTARSEYVELNCVFVWFVGGENLL
jgi:replicative superfamily II helicase